MEEAAGGVVEVGVNFRLILHKYPKSLRDHELHIVCHRPAAFSCVGNSPKHSSDHRSLKFYAHLSAVPQYFLAQN